VRLVARLLIAAAVASLPVGLALMSCGSSAVGITACREIEVARCNVAQVCEPGFNVGACTQYYNDECLVGIENPSDAGDTVLTMEATPCVNAIDQLAACIDAGTSIEACTGLLTLVDAGLECGDASPEAGPPDGCQVLTVCPELLTNCNFVATPLAVNGAACSAGTSCASGSCIDSICCASSNCTGECLTGTCTTGTCDLQPPGFACQNGTCTGAGNDTLQGLGVCDGTTAACHTSTTEITCTAGTCSITGCTSCTADTQCSAFGWCSAGACTAQGLTGAPCSAADMCVNGCSSSKCL
jgi:hypothetical protein